MPLADERQALRIVVVFGGGGSDASVVGVLASLVSERAADITGVFLEDHSLFRLAELPYPFTTELCRITTARRPLTAGTLKRQMKVQALHAERALRSVAERAGSTWSFRTHRGRLSTALAETRDVGLVLLGTAQRALASAGALRVTARMADAGGAESLRPVAVLFDQPDTGARALSAGMELADRTGRGLIVFLSGEARDAHWALIQKLQPMGPKRAAIRTIPSTELGAILTAVRRAAPVVLIVGASEAGFEEPRISALQGDLRCPVAVVR
jgi:hypothetical protein